MRRVREDQLPRREGRAHAPASPSTRERKKVSWKPNVARAGLRVAGDVPPLGAQVRMAAEVARELQRASAAAPTHAAPRAPTAARRGASRAMARSLSLASSASMRRCAAPQSPKALATQVGIVVARQVALAGIAQQRHDRALLARRARISLGQRQHAEKLVPVDGPTLRPSSARQRAHRGDRLARPAPRSSGRPASRMKLAPPAAGRCPRCASPAPSASASPLGVVGDEHRALGVGHAEPACRGSGSGRSGRWSRWCRRCRRRPRSTPAPGAARAPSAANMLSAMLLLPRQSVARSA